MKVVISMGGSILASPAPNVDLIRDFASLLISMKSEGHIILVVVGGGQLARDYIAAVKALGADWKESDGVGIAATRMNAMLLSAALGEYGAYEIPGDTGIDCESPKITVMGGVKPGQTTDAVAAELAVRCNFDMLLIATNVDGVYESDPRESPDAKKIKSMNTSELISIVGDEHSPGMKAVVDPVAAAKIHKSGTKTIVVDGQNLKNIENAINGKEHNGTEIVPV
jgi:uridylate kinase